MLDGEQVLLRGFDSLQQLGAYYNFRLSPFCPLSQQASTASAISLSSSLSDIALSPSSNTLPSFLRSSGLLHGVHALALLANFSHKRWLWIAGYGGSWVLSTIGQSTLTLGFSLAFLPPRGLWLQVRHLAAAGGEEEDGPGGALVDVHLNSVYVKHNHSPPTQVVLLFSTRSRR